MSPLSLAVVENVVTTSPVSVMMCAALDRVATSTCVAFRGIIDRCTTDGSAVIDSHGGRNEATQSAVLPSHSLTVPSLEPVSTRPPSPTKMAALTNESCPRNSFSILPARRPWMRAVRSKEPLSTRRPSLEKVRQVTPPACAPLILRSAAPVDTRHTLMRPSFAPVATISPSSLLAIDRTASSCIMNSSRAWYARFLSILPLSTSHTSTKPSTLPVTRCVPSAVNVAHSG
mmetsp:Transcript_17119/g.60085  ORF Transcript_17119/g.60085 Transcript_17119/m.60085 type:complete len:230 (-) Transcript_17119:683-1372(-)